MKILVTGRGGKSGSWQIRGEQLGRAIGARVDPLALDLDGADLAVVVKRPRPDTLMRLRAAGAPIVWDVVDAWPQPIGNEWDKAACMEWLCSQVDAIRPAAIVAATEVMANDCAEFGLPVLALPHHPRPGQPVNPVRETVATVGYEGGEQYLGYWREILESTCRARGWRFVVNPPALADLDIVVALRAARGYAAKHWKSNVKLANAQATRTPSICGRESGYMETAFVGQWFVTDEDGLYSAFDALTDIKERAWAVRRLIDRRLELESIAERYLTWLQSLVGSKFSHRPERTQPAA